MNIPYLHKKQSAKPTYFEPVVIPPPPGSMSAPTVIPEKIIPPLNTDILRRPSTRSFSLRNNPKIANMAASSIPENFDWAHTTNEDSEQVKNKKKYIQKVGNQQLCGSCWAISGVQIISDNFVVSGIIDYDPKLSTTWVLSNYPQGQCNGGNPAQLFEDTTSGIASDHCIDYSWCSKNENCNGNATKHFEEKEIDLNTLIPPPGCYFNDSKHYVYKTEPAPQIIDIGVGGITAENAAITVKKHIFNNGPVCGGFLVYKNFMKGNFHKTDSGIYFDKGIYDDKGNVTFSKDALSTDNYAGAHAVAIIGWGIAKNVICDSNNKRDDVPYWYCRNSWTSNWCDNGYFKMAMYPFNKVAQFDKTVKIKVDNQTLECGGIIMLNVSKNPEIKTLKNIPSKISQKAKENSDEYYKNESDHIKKQKEKIVASEPEKNKESHAIGLPPNINNHLLKVMLITIAILTLILFLAKRKKNEYNFI